MHIKVTVHPDTAEDKVVATAEDEFDVWTQAPARDGQANRQTVALVAAELSLSSGQLKIVKGGHRPNKILKVTNV